jgi:hypothetical protein
MNARLSFLVSYRFIDLICLADLVRFGLGDGVRRALCVLTMAFHLICIYFCVCIWLATFSSRRHVRFSSDWSMRLAEVEMVESQTKKWIWQRVEPGEEVILVTGIDTDVTPRWKGHIGTEIKQVHDNLPSHLHIPNLAVPSSYRCRDGPRCSTSRMTIRKSGFGDPREISYSSMHPIHT